MSQAAKAPRIQHFILLFDRRAGQMIDQLSFGFDARAAMQKYEELEEEHRHEAHIDIVLVGSDSLDTVRVTHANYFDDIAEDQYAALLGLNPTS